jgi:hypothetical protein
MKARQVRATTEPPETRAWKATYMDAKQVRDEIDKYLDEHDLKLVRLPIYDPMERRAVCLKLALDAKGVAFSLKNDASVADAATDVIAAATHYESYVFGATEAQVNPA